MMQTIDLQQNAVPFSSAQKAGKGEFPKRFDCRRSKWKNYFAIKPFVF